MKKEEVLKKLKGFIYSEFGTAKNYAEHIGVSSSFVSNVLKGNKELTEKMLNDIKVSRKIVYFQL